MSKSKENKAVALKYNAESDMAPVVIASGYGDIADKIIDIAEKNGIPVFRDDSAASLLCMLEVGNNIPEELYQVVAAIYCQLLKISSEIKNKGNNNSMEKTTTKTVQEMLKNSRRER
jgi:flagellar biosynthesis protein